ncbi:MAG: glycosyltransferase, partial [Desulfitobacterium hafniense]|nr:glycosyltransferase [Desulfitobacterium hafniense]
MRICFLGDAGSIHLQRWIKYFIETGYEVEVISFRPCPVSGVRVHILGGGSGGRLDYVLAMFRIKSLLEMIKPDILHAHYATSFGLLSVLSGFHPLVVSAWGSDVLVAPQQSLWLRKIVCQVLKTADALTSDSEYMSNRMEELLDGRKKVLKTVTMGVSRSWFERLPQIDKNSRQILSLRGHQEIYNIDTIITAMAKVIKAIPDARLVIAGEGAETLELKNLSQSLGLTQNVSFVGQLPHAKVQQYLNESAISVSVP